MKRLFLAMVATAIAALAFGAVAQADESPQFRLGFANLASMIPDVVGTPLENEHSMQNGDSIQRTTTGVMVWRKADNVTAFTNGSETWLIGPEGLQERGNDQRFPWEQTEVSAGNSQLDAAAAPASPTPTAQAPAATAPVATPTPTPAPAKPMVRSSQPTVIQGQGLEAGTVWVLGELRNDGSTPAYNVVVSCNLVSDSGGVVGSGSRAFPYLGPGDVVGYGVEIRGAGPYARTDVSVDASATGFASYVDVPVQWVKNEQVATTIKKTTYVEYQFSGNLSNSTSKPASLNAVYVWFLDDQNRVVWADFTFLPQQVAPGEVAPFMITTPLDRDNPLVRGITQVRYYAAGQTQ